MRWQERQREMKRTAIERAKKQREAQEQRTSENVRVEESDDDLQVVKEAQEEVQEEVHPIMDPQEGQSSEENEPSQEVIDMDEYGLLEREFSTEYDISEQLEEVQEVATEVEFSTEYDLEHLGEEPQLQESQEESNTESDKLEERTDNALQQAIAMLRRTERPK